MFENLKNQLPNTWFCYSITGLLIRDKRYPSKLFGKTVLKQEGHLLTTKSTKNSLASSVAAKHSLLSTANVPSSTKHTLLLSPPTLLKECSMISFSHYSLKPGIFRMGRKLTLCSNPYYKVSSSVSLCLCEMNDLAKHWSDMVLL